MKKYFIIVLLVTVCVGLLANESVASTTKSNDSSIASRDMWDILNTFETSLGSMPGIETDGTNIYTSTWNSEIFTRYDMNGAILGDFSIAGVSDIRDMAYDGTYFYGSPASTTINIMDLANETLIGTIPVTCSGVSVVTHIAFDPELDGGNGGFWLGDLNTFGAVTMDGSEIHSNLTLPGFVWGSAYDPWTAGGPYIWLLVQEGPYSTLHQFEIETLSLTGVTHDVSGATVPASSGGLATYVNDDEIFVMLVNLQQSPNLVGVLEIAEATPPGYIEGTVTLDGGTGDVQSVLITAGNRETNPDVDGNYSIEIHQGTYDVTATLGNYDSDTVVDVVVEEGVITGNIDLTLVYNPPTYDPPQNLAVDEETGLFTWDAPASGNLTGYDIYLDSVFLENITDTEFTFLNLVFEQTYLAGVSAVYDDGVSEIVEISFTYTPILSPPSNVLVDESEGIISWEEPILTNNRDLLGYDVYLDGQLKGSTSNFEWQYIDLVSNQNYTAGVIAIYDEGSSEIVEINFTYTGTSAGNDMISTTNLIGNYPNPFNPTTTISFSLTTENMESTELTIYNLKGQKVKTLVNKKMNTGIHQIVWNGDDENNKPVSSGMYLYKLKSGVYTSTKKMILMK